MNIKSLIGCFALVVGFSFSTHPLFGQKQGKKVSRAEYLRIQKENKRLTDSLRTAKRSWEAQNRAQETELNRLSTEVDSRKDASHAQLVQLNLLADSLLEIAHSDPDTARAHRLIGLLNRRLGPATSRSFDLGRNLARGSQELEFLSQDFYIFIADLAEDTVRIHWQDKEKENFSSLGHLKDWLKTQGDSALMLTNGGMYTPAHTPQGLYVENGNTAVELDTTDGGSQSGMNFFMLPNGVFGMDSTGFFVEDTRDFERDSAIFATQSGPMLIRDWEMHPKFNRGSKNKYVRSGVGVINPQKVVFAISKKPVNFFDFSSLFRNYFGCRNALYLDGAISRMYIPELSEDLGGHFGPIISVTKK